MTRTTYRARWLMPVTAPPIENGLIVVEDGLLASIAHADPNERADVDFHDAVVMPGFVNAHTHLELSFCQGSVPFQGSFVQWVENLVALCRQATSPDQLTDALQVGLQCSLDAGVTLVGDIGYGLRSIGGWRNAPIGVVGFLEVLGMGPRRFSSHDQSFERLRALCDETVVSDRFRVGLSPHAPYSVDATVIRDIVAYAKTAHRPIAMHLAETLDEVRFLAQGDGPFRDLLERWGLWDGSFEVPRCLPVEYAERVGLLECRPVLCHVNYATDHELDLLARYRSHVVYCPRSHAFFRHDTHPWRDMLDRGINVCVGTDSLASNQTLSVLDELRFLFRQNPDINPDRLIAMGTIAGARALGCGKFAGSLEVGKAADWVVVPLADTDTSLPAVNVLACDAKPAAVYRAGEPVFVDGSRGRSYDRN